jgi:hypothetical protein
MGRRFLRTPFVSGDGWGALGRGRRKGASRLQRGGPSLRRLRKWGRGGVCRADQVTRALLGVNESPRFAHKRGRGVKGWWGSRAPYPVRVIGGEGEREGGRTFRAPPYLPRLRGVAWHRPHARRAGRNRVPPPTMGGGTSGGRGPCGNRGMRGRGYACAPTPVRMRLPAKGGARRQLVEVRGWVVGYAMETRCCLRVVYHYF